MAETDAGKPVPFRGGGFLPRHIGGVGPLVFLAVIGIREAGCRSGLIPPLVLPGPSEALAALAHPLESGLLWKHLGASLQRLAAGWTLGTLLGVAVGVSIGLFSLARAGLGPMVAALFPIPVVERLVEILGSEGVADRERVQADRHHPARGGAVLVEHVEPVDDHPVAGARPCSWMTGRHGRAPIAWVRMLHRPALLDTGAGPGGLPSRAAPGRRRIVPAGGGSCRKDHRNIVLDI